jgi:DNA polymerase elongation subunit (family B)
VNKEPRILLFDVETAPVKIWTFALGKTYLGHNQIADGERFDIITIAYKWLGEKKVHSLDWGLKKQDSSEMIEKFTKVIESADLVVAHNLTGFDLKQMNTQRFMHGQPTIAWPTTADTLTQLRRHFYFASNRLDYITKTLFGAGKDKMSLDDWVAIKERKDPRALAKMIKYNIKDVLLLEKLFIKLQPYMRPAANIYLQPGDTAARCPNCGSTSSKSHGRRVTMTRVYQRRRCTSCHAIFNGPQIKDTE